MGSPPSVSDSNRTFTFDPSDNLSYSTTYKIRVTTGVKDSSGKTLSSQYETSSGFTTIWKTQQFGTSNQDYGLSLSVDPIGNIYITGFTYGGLDGNINSGENDLFLVKYNSSGVKQWTRQMGTSLNDYGDGTVIDSSNNIYVTGTTGGGLDGNISSGGYDIFLVKYNSRGVKQWSKQMGTSSNEWGYGMSVDSSENLYITGYTEGGLDGNTNSGGKDVFLVKYNSSGEKQWTRQIGTSSDDHGWGVTIDSYQNVFLTGYTWGNLLGNKNTGSFDVFLMKFNSSGVLQ